MNLLPPSLSCLPKRAVDQTFSLHRSLKELEGGSIREHDAEKLREIRKRAQNEAYSKIRQKSMPIITPPNPSTLKDSVPIFLLLTLPRRRRLYSTMCSCNLGQVEGNDLEMYQIEVAMVSGFAFSGKSHFSLALSHCIAPI